MDTSLRISIGQFSDRGVKEANEDSYGVLVPQEPLLSNKGIAAVVADGLSASECAKEASETCVKSFLSDYFDTPETWGARTAAGRVLSATNRWLYAQSQARFQSDLDMASTFSALVMKGGTGFLFHVGDSRIGMIRDGGWEPLTRDHKIHSDAGREFLSKAMGVAPDVEVDYRSFPLQRGDIYIFTTDGVHEHVSGHAMMRFIAEHGDDLNGAAVQICKEAFDAGSGDNLTCQIVRIDMLGERDAVAYHKALTELPFPPELEAGMILDGYRIVRDLHLSARSQVYLAVDDDTGEKVALKTPSVSYNDDPTFLECFSREEWIGQTVSSPHVARTLPPRVPRQFLYTLLEYIEGQTLGQWIQDNPEPDLNSVRSIVEQIIAGLRALHRKEIIHHDLKPDNIVLDTDGTVKIVDFGSVRILGLEEADPLTVPSHAMGTVAYAAPELVVGGKATTLSDLYSLAAIIYEMLTGKHPYGKGFTGEFSVARAKYRPLSEHRRDVPLWVDGALKKALSLDPAQRQLALSELSADLHRANPAYLQEHVPVIQRNPVAFWQGLSALLCLIIILLLVIR